MNDVKAFNSIKDYPPRITANKADGGDLSIPSRIIGQIKPYLSAFSVHLFQFHQGLSDRSNLTYQHFPFTSFNSIKDYLQKQNNIHKTI